MFKKNYKPLILVMGVLIALVIYGNFQLIRPTVDTQLHIEQPNHGQLVLFTDVIELTAKHMLFLKEKSR